MANGVWKFVFSPPLTTFQEPTSGNIQSLRITLTRHKIAALCAEQVFASPVLFSGMAFLLLTRSDIDVVSRNVKETTESA